MRDRWRPPPSPPASRDRRNLLVQLQAAFFFPRPRHQGSPRHSPPHRRSAASLVRSSRRPVGFSRVPAGRRQQRETSWPFQEVGNDKFAARGSAPSVRVHTPPPSPPTPPLFVSISSRGRSNEDLSLPVRTIHLSSAAAAARSGSIRLPLQVGTFVTRQNRSLIHPSGAIFFFSFFLNIPPTNQHAQSHFLNVLNQFVCNFSM